MKTISDKEAKSAFEGWAILELMGHRRLGGFVSETTFAGAGFVRIDVPADSKGNGGATQLYGASAIYCITATTETIARAAAELNRPEPVQRWELPQLRPPKGTNDAELILACPSCDEDVLVPTEAPTYRCEKCGHEWGREEDVPL